MAEPVHGLIRVDDWLEVRKAVFYDMDYSSSWVKNSPELARAFMDAGFVPLTAFQLREWMTAQITGGADGSICFFSQDIVPEMVADDCSPTCLVMEYIKAGGRVVWVGDIPFYYQGRRGRKVEIWGNGGHKKALGFPCVWDLKEPAELTEAGREWGLTAPGNVSRCVPASDVTVPLSVSGKHASFYFKNYNPALPHSGFLRLREFIPVADLLKAAMYGIEEPEEAEAAASRPAAPAAEQAGDGVLVGSGTFVVDKQRALDKLMRFQLPDPENCLLPMIRCAHCVKASEISVSELQEGGLELRFDGEPLERERLAEPYSALFEPRSAANAAARHLATGLLCALRLNPQVITVSGGSPGARYRLKIDALGRESMQPSVGPGKGTVVRLLWRGTFGPLRNSRLLLRVRERCTLSPVPLLINGRDIPRGRSSGGGLYFEEGALHGQIAVPRRAASVSELTPAVANVTLDNALMAKLPYLQVLGYVNSDDFTLNISQTGVVNNTRCGKAVAAVARQVPLLLEYVLRMHTESLPAAARAMAYGGLDKYWRKCVEGGLPSEAGLLAGLLRRARELVSAGGRAAAARREQAEAMVSEAARVTMWLREAAGRLLTEYDKNSEDRILRTLWEVPLFFTINAETRSLAQVQAQHDRMGFVPFSTQPYLDVRLPFDVLWCPCQRDLELLARWDTSDITYKIPHYGVNPAAAEEFICGAGQRLIAARHNIVIMPRSRAGAKKTPVQIEMPELAAAPTPPPPPPPPAPPAPAPEPPAPPAVPARRRQEVHETPPAFPSPEDLLPEEPKTAGKRRAARPMPSEEDLAADPGTNYPEYLARQLARVRAPGARLVAKFIRDLAAEGDWAETGLAQEVLESGLPPLQKADYLLSVLYTEFNRREVKLTDADDINFQRALAELARRGGTK